MASDQLTQLAGRWRYAEQQLYPSLLSDEALYERVVNLVGQLVDELSACTSEQDLLAAYEQRQRLLDTVTGQLADEAGLVDPELVAAAAFRLRLDGVRSEQQWRKAGARVAAARGDGHAQWVELFARGQAGSAPGRPSERLVAYVPDGRGDSVVPALHTWVGPDPDTDGLRYGVAVLAVDVSTEMPRPLADPLAGPHEFGAEEPWRAEIERLQAWAARPGGLPTARDETATSL